MQNITKISSNDRKEEFKSYIQNHVKKSAAKYIRDLEKGFSIAPVPSYDSICDITDLEILEDGNATKA